ncbi:gephyrin-like molybdotransferase Glp [Marinicella rhabdoformis]|uniref:molybdopterin molybdotransferase MoeA n=1 Tax=Marinicella rhabdoformis TaxID=2580566 RepID=UPI0012AED332|nr:gephyrin-like molybdotransferase Glp [Marinicella rhabdoformis]
MKPLISYQQTLEILTKVALNHPWDQQQTVDLPLALNHMTAAPVNSPIQVPSFDNSAMDGFAVVTSEVNEQLQQQSKASLGITGRIQAGDSDDVSVSRGLTAPAQAWEIMTGAPVPKGFDAVVPVEAVHVDGDQVIFEKTVELGQNIRKAGTDYDIGQPVVGVNQVIQAQHIMALATVGVKKISVKKPVPVALFSTGNELSDDENSSGLAAGKIHNSNQPFLRAYLSQIDCDVTFEANCQDDEAAFELLLNQAAEKQVKVIISTGAVSMGRYDFIPSILKKRGATVHFHKAKVRPGKPILFAELPDGTLYFGLPGNPIAAASGARFFLTPLLRMIKGMPPEATILAKTMCNIDKKQGFRTFAKAQLSLSKTGQLQANMLTGQGSFQTHSFAESNCWLVLPEEAEHIAAGEYLAVLPMIPGSLTVS